MDTDGGLAEFYGPENIRTFMYAREALAADGRPDAIIFDVGCVGMDWEERAHREYRLLREKFSGATFFATDEGILEGAIMLRWPEVTDVMDGKTSLPELWTEIMSQYGIKPE